MGKEIIRKYTIYSILFTFGGAFTFAVYTLYLRAHGLSFLESNLINVAFFLTITLLEIPTGMIGDFFGRKQAMLLAISLSGIGFLIYGVADVIWMFILAEVIVGVGRTFHSGSAVAWLKDNLDAVGSDRSLSRIISTVGVQTRIVIIIGGVLGNVLYNFQINLPYFAGLIFSVAGFIYVFAAMEERYGDNHDDSIEEFRQILPKVIQVIRTEKRLMAFALMYFWFFFGVMVVNMTWAPYVDEVLEMPGLVKWTWVLMVLVIALGQWIVSRYLPDGKERSWISISLLLAGIPLVFMPIAATVGFLGILVIHELGRGMIQPLLESYPNHFLTSQTRATALSLFSMFAHFGGMFGLIISGYITDLYGIEIGWAISGVLLVLTALAWLQTPARTTV